MTSDNDKEDHYFDPGVVHGRPDRNRNLEGVVGSINFSPLESKERLPDVPRVRIVADTERLHQQGQMREQLAEHEIGAGRKPAKPLTTDIQTVLAGKIGPDTEYRLNVTGSFTLRELDNLIHLLEAQRRVYRGAVELPKNSALGNYHKLPYCSEVYYDE